MSNTLALIVFMAIGYLFGSLPFALWITRWLKGVDIRDAGSGHVSTTNTIRQAGFLPGVAVLILDLVKGFIPTYLAISLSPSTWIVPFVAAAAVAGHCWPIFAQFRGGMGLATAGGCIFAINPFGIALGLLVLLPLTLILKHAARASLIASLLFAPIFYLFGERGILIGATAVVGAVLALRFTIDWNRQYRELWLDRENSGE